MAAKDTNMPSGRRRQISGSARRTRQQSKTAAIEATSAHVADPFLQEFLDPAFDSVEYWNNSLPSLRVAGTSQAASQAGSKSLPLAELPAQAQATLSQLNAHTTRLTTTLTQLTDDILRSGSRLAYEVELLRGETLGLSEALTEGLREDVVKFVPEGINESAERHVQDQRRISVATQPEATTQRDDDLVAEVAPTEPSYITQLRTLTLVRSRLDSVIKTFGDAMEFVFPPSELSVSSSFLSVSAPETGSESHSTEEKGQQVLQKLRDEISGYLSNQEDPVKGVEDAARRIEELKELNKVWKGTAEEKGRAKFIESLAKIVEDKHRDLLRIFGEPSAVRSQDTDSKETTPGEFSTESRGYSAGYGLISQLQKIRSGL